MDILEPLRITTKGNEYVVVTTDRYSKLSKAVPTVCKTTKNVACIFLHDRIIRYRIPTYLLTDNDTKITSRFFATFCTHLGSKQND